MKFAVCFLVTFLAAAEQPHPTPTVSVPCRVVDVVDGDTLTVEVRLLARVRLLDCWAPEMNTPEGSAAKERMQEIAQGKDAMLVVPLSQRMRLDDILTFGRVLGRVHVEGRDVGAVLVEENLATVGKER